MRRLSLWPLISALIFFAAGFLTHALYVRWQTPDSAIAVAPSPIGQPAAPSGAPEPQSHRVKFSPLPAPATALEKAPELPVVAARDVEHIRSLAGNQARIRGRVFKVGHSAKSNTYFLNFGPSRGSFTAVIFASAVDSFEKKKMPPSGFDGREVELQGTVKDHPQYGLEVILESPAQIRILQ
ncbi:MAG: hypothetical protein FJ145_09080 [Deltaproteobacteria bacterium]|nr:hypothetical protein [Deltaproteobacteria bacterium]